MIPCPLALRQRQLFKIGKVLRDESALSRPFIVNIYLEEDLEIWLEVVRE